MQKISTYLYPNRIELLADLAGFTTEFTNVYQRNVKIYNGVDNVLEFDIKNADQKRLDLETTPSITSIQLNVMDAQGNALPNSPYIIDPVAGIKGLARAVIPKQDLDNLDHQFLNYSVTALQDSYDIPLYADSRFGAVGKMELVGNAMPTSRTSQVLTSFYSDVHFSTVTQRVYHSSAIQNRFYEAVQTTTATIEFYFEGLEGTVTIEATKDASISSESFTLRGTTVDTVSVNPSMGHLTLNYTDLADYPYLRISYTQIINNNGKIAKVIVS